jgi:hypothetical protein
MTTHSPTLLAGAAALVLSGLAPATVAANPPNRHELTIQLPGGGTERIEYTGEAPRVVFDPSPTAWSRMAPADFWTPPSFASFERMSADVERSMDALFRDQQSLLSGVSRFNRTSLANIPPGAISTTWVSTTTGSGFCTRETRITRTSAEAKPEIVSRQSGDCGTKSATGPSPGKSPDHDDGIIETSLKSSASDARPGTF